MIRAYPKGLGHYKHKDHDGLAKKALTSSFVSLVVWREIEKKNRVRAEFDWKKDYSTIAHAKDLERTEYLTS